MVHTELGGQSTTAVIFFSYTQSNKAFSCSVALKKRSSVDARLEQAGDMEVVCPMPFVAICWFHSKFTCKGTCRQGILLWQQWKAEQGNDQKVEGVVEGEDI